MNIIGISAFYHESACCLIQDGKLLAAAAEERFTRVKHDPRLPVQAFRYCLAEGGIGPADIDCIAYYELPELKLSRQLWSGRPGAAATDWSWLDAGHATRSIRERLGYDGLIEMFPHHLAHAAGSFFFSGFPEAAIMTVDGVGEWATTTYGYGSDSVIELFEEVHFPHSLGLLYAAITSYLGFRVNDGEYKVMGLAPYGKPAFLRQMRRLIASSDGFQFCLDMRYFDFVTGSRMFSPALIELFGMAPRRPETKITDRHCDLARSLQTMLEEILIEKVRCLAERSTSPNLCMSGGVALNCVANGRILREGPFERLFVQPAAGDDGSCLGAAALAFAKRTGRRHSYEALATVGLGPAYGHDEITALLLAAGLDAENYREREPALVADVADRLARGQVIGWFHGRMEFGPRALGARSILANPMDPDIRTRLNGLVKKRESFRPFAPSVLADRAGNHFVLDHPSPFMLETCQVNSHLDLPGITHVDQSARPQTVTAETAPRFARLLAAFEQRTGCPILVNTSFNVRGEPIVCTPSDALFCFADAGLDALVLEDFIIDRQTLPANWESLIAAWRHRPRSPFAKMRSAIHENLYTFV